MFFLIIPQMSTMHRLDQISNSQSRYAKILIKSDKAFQMFAEFYSKSNRVFGNFFQLRITQSLYSQLIKGSH